MSNQDGRAAGPSTPPPGRFDRRGVVRNLVLLGVLVAVVAALASRPGARPDGRDAAVSCAASVRERLPAPSTARFERPEEVKVSRRGDDWVVAGFVVSRDSAGARETRRYTCVLQPATRGDWRLMELTLIQSPH